jgi:putative ABC transport system substrate-binding protein
MGWSWGARAQHPAPGKWRIGLVQSSERGQKIILEGLRELGYVEGQNLSVELRRTDGSAEKLAAVATELVQARVDVIVAAGTQAARALQLSTKDIPIIMFSSDPVRAGLVASLARPGGNVTGFSMVTPDVSGKRLELLREATGESKFGVLWNSDDPTNAASLRETADAAHSIGLELTDIAVQNSNQFDAAVGSLAANGTKGLVIVMSPLMDAQLARIAGYCNNARLASIYPSDLFVHAGGLMSYGADFASLFQRVPFYLDRLFKGAKPADLPVEQPTKYSLTINVRAAKAMGIAVPPSLLTRADGVIE